LGGTLTPNLWVPVCCARVMRYNVFAQQGGAGYGVLVCSVCNKSVTFELEHQVDVSMYGEGSRALSMLGSPKPPNVERKKLHGDAEVDDKTL
jgi:hypothetical protein